MILAPTNRRIIRPGDKPSFEHTQRYGLIKGHWANARRVLFLLFNEGSGDQVFDLSGNRSTGTFVADTHFEAGSSGPAVIFDGIDDLINLDSYVSHFDLTNITIIAGVKCSDDTPNYIFDIKEAADNDASILAIGNGLTGHLTDELIMVMTNRGGGVMDNRVGYVSANRSQLFDGNSHQVGFVASGSYKFYLDGILKPTTVGNGNNDGDWGAGFVADQARMGRGYNGAFEYLMFYNQGLSASEMAQLAWDPFLGIERRTAPVYFFVPTAPFVGGLSNVTENKVLEHIVGKAPFSKPTAYIGFCTANPGEEATGVDCNEVPNTNNYARTACANWNAAADGEIDNSSVIASPYATGNWGEVTHYVLVDSPTYGEGNVLVYDELDSSVTIEEGDNLEFAAGDLVLTLD